jgi:hypothetical protein
MNSVSRLDQDRQQDMSGLASLPGLEAVSGQLAGLIAVLRAEQARRQAGAAVRRPAWKNLVFTGGRVPARPGRPGPFPGGHRLPRLHRRTARRDLRHPGRRGRVHPHPRSRPQGRHRPGPGRSRPWLRKRPASRPAPRPGHRQPGPTSHNRLHLPGSGRAEHDPRDGHPRAHPSHRPARTRPMARPVPIAGRAVTGRGTNRQRLLPIQKAGRLFYAPLFLNT